MTDKQALILLNMVDGLGPLKISRLMASLDRPRDIFSAGIKHISLIIGERLALKVKEKIGSREFAEELRLIERSGVEILTILDKDYPENLSRIYAPPAVLYLKGNKDFLKNICIAIVGSRRASVYGREEARRFAFDLGSSGFTIVSGLARGIDTYAHRGALEAKAKTVAVLGNGLYSIYPEENKRLAEKIAESGCIVSEFSLKTAPLRQNFPQRNRIISGLSLGVLVVEAAQKSGALITVNYALEQNREVFAVPGRIDSPVGKGVNSLIKQGAKLVENIDDILEEFNIKAVRL